jgi:hypothetical protein
MESCERGFCGERRVTELLASLKQEEGRKEQVWASRKVSVRLERGGVRL